MKQINNILKYKTPSRLPQEEGFYSGDCPGAAAITIILSLFSSPRVSPTFAGVKRHALSGFPNGHITCKPLSAYLARKSILPVTNQQASHQGSFVPLMEGDESRFIGTGGPGDKTPGTQGVNETPRKTRMKGFKTERRYAYVLS
jgi:hypothetical protein